MKNHFEQFDKIINKSQEDTQYFETGKTKNDLTFNGIWNGNYIQKVKDQTNKLARNSKYQYSKSKNKIKRLG